MSKDINPVELLKSVDRTVLREEFNRSMCERSLAFFIQHFWKYIDPSDFVGGIHIDAICLHLEAVTRGDIRRLAVNIPPRHSKSSVVSVAWPVWTWVQQQIDPLAGPQVQFLFSSYAQRLSERDSVKCRRLIESPLFQKYWGNRFALVGDQNTKQKFENDKGGYRLSTSAGGTLTGEGGLILCIPKGSLINTPYGGVKIEDINIGDKLYCFDHSLGKVVTSMIENKSSRESDDVYEICTTSGHKFRCTGNHPVYAAGKGYVRADCLGKDDRLVVQTRKKNIFALALRFLRETIHKIALRSEEIIKSKKCSVLLLKGLLPETPCSKEYKILCCLWKATKTSAFKLLFNPLFNNISKKSDKGKDLYGVWVFLQKKNSVLQPYLRRYSAFKKNAWQRKLQLQKTWEVFQSIYKNIEINKRARRKLLLCMWRVKQNSREEESILASCSSYKREHKGQQAGELDNSLLLMPQDAPSWEFSDITTIRKIGGRKVDVYDIQVKREHNFFVDGVLVHNCADDPNNAVDVESDAERASVLEWWQASWQTRLNDPKTGAMVVIQQRLHQEDVTGFILDNDKLQEWEFLCLPLEYDSSRHCKTSIGWSDPRTYDGEILCPERFGEKEVESLKQNLGPYRCTPAESPVLMADLTLKSISEVKIGDEVIGFNVDTCNSKKRRHLKKVKVTKTYSYVADVVKVTLDSGKIIRCTPDHKWYMGKQGGNRGWFKDGRRDTRPLYMEAIIGRKLMRVCDAELPIMSAEEQRMGGWLGGFFDGDGSASSCGKKSINGRNSRNSSTIAFYQGTGRNLHICNKLEEILSHFGFRYVHRDVVRSDRIVNKNADYKNRCYRINVEGLTTFQRFLHVAKPTKWRDRLISGALGAQFINKQETVISIEPDGCEPVYALETESGNYVVWGIASSNSAGQLQQMPMPKGGGIFKRDWWQLWPPEGYDDSMKLAFPPMDYIVVSIDTAYTSKQENDYSACVMLGVFRDKGKLPRIMLMKAWQEKLEFHALVEKVIETCRNKGGSIVDALLIEAKASGLSVAQEVQRLCGDEEFAIHKINPGAQDKVARAYSVQHLFSNGVVYAPDRKYADMVITQAEVFPKGKNDDAVDALVQGVSFLRKIGLAVLAEEGSRAVTEEAMFRPQSESIADNYGV